MQRRDVKVSWTSFLLAFTLLLHGFQNGKCHTIVRLLINVLLNVALHSKGSSLAISRSIPEEKKLAINSRKQVNR